MKQLMNEGNLYTDAGDVPSKYWGTSAQHVKYIQTADLDFTGDPTDIRPIGSDLINQFYGDFNGNGFKISNWSYVDPEFETDNDCNDHVGIFGAAGNANIVNVTVDGVCTIQGFTRYAGFVVGGFYGSVFENVECNLAYGSFIERGTTSSTLAGWVGAVGGTMNNCKVIGVTLKGHVDFRMEIEEIEYAGGVFGSLVIRLSPISVGTLIQNLATFPNPIRGETVGGVIGYSRISGPISKVINAMIGDLLASNTAGGVIGEVYRTNTTQSVDTLINSMTGNISTTSSALHYTGGVVGSFSVFGSFTVSHLLNYMTGDIVSLSPWNDTRDGGIVGSGSSSLTIANSINAMNGSVNSAIVGVSVSVSSATTNTNFGLTFEDDNHGTSTPPSGLLTNSDFPDLPYASLDSTDSAGNPIEFDFVYANLSGNSTYSAHTHAVLHTGDVSTPFGVDFDISESNTTVYTTLINKETVTVTQPALTVLDIVVIIPPLAVEARSINIPVTISEVTGATGYNITYEGPTGGEVTAVSGTTTLEHNITGLVPETEYTIKLYADTGAGYALTEELTATTLPNVAANYDITDFHDSGGVTDLTTLDATTLATMASVLPGLVDTGDVVTVALPTEPALSTSFVAEGDTLSIENIDGILLPFDQSSGAGQTVFLTLSDGTTTVPVTYDEVADTITVDSVSSGDTFYLDDKKLQVFDYYGLTAVSVATAPLLVEPLSINIPVVITEVPGAVRYKISYVGPDGFEVTKLTDVTALEQNITGLVADTEYVIKLYADTGSGYVLTEELTATTLANTAANYDVTHLVQDGVINLSPLPDDTIANISEVINELFNTGDVVQVSVQGKAELNTSFIKLGEQLSIEKIDGVLLPFVQSSGAGQAVGVVLSDGSTTVSIDYDDALNGVTVNEVVYYPGDTFVLDGQKVSVAEY